MKEDLTKKQKKLENDARMLSWTQTILLKKVVDAK